MKQAFILLLLISITATCFGQKSMPAPSIQSDYLEKSKHQNTTAWILLAGGAALFTIGTIIPRVRKNGAQFQSTAAITKTTQ